MRLTQPPVRFCTAALGRTEQHDSYVYGQMMSGLNEKKTQMHLMALSRKLIGRSETRPKDVQCENDVQKMRWELLKGETKQAEGMR